MWLSNNRQGRLGVNPTNQDDGAEDESQCGTGSGFVLKMLLACHMQ